MMNYKIQTSIFGAIIISPFFSEAQAAAATASSVSSGTLMLYALIVLLAIGLFFQTIILRRFVKLIMELQYRIKHGKDMPVETYKAEIAGTSKPASGLFESLTRSVPMGAEKDMMLDHNYDGIRELDNRMPPWLQYIFISTIVFAFIYFFLFQVYDIGKNPTQEYAAELQAAGFAKTERLKTAAASVDEASVVQLADATSLAAGKAIFISKCVACHGNNGEGNVGPNLTDDYWIHGGTVNEMFKTVKYGVPAKGMVPWQGILKPEEMQDAVSYIMTLHGTNPANAKAPQGVLYNPSAAAVDSTTAVTDTTKLKI